MCKMGGPHSLDAVLVYSRLEVHKYMEKRGMGGQEASQSGTADTVQDL